MNVFPKYKVIDPYNYDRIIHNKKKIMLGEKIYSRSDKWKVSFDFEDKTLCNSLNTLKVKHLSSYLFCSW